MIEQSTLEKTDIAIIKGKTPQDGVLEGIEKKKIKVQEINTNIPGPFAMNLITQGHADIMKIEDKQEFLKRMHNNVMAKLGKKMKIETQK